MPIIPHSSENQVNEQLICLKIVKFGKNDGDFQVCQNWDFKLNYDVVKFDTLTGLMPTETCQNRFGKKKSLFLASQITNPISITTKSRGCD